MALIEYFGRVRAHGPWTSCASTATILGGFVALVLAACLMYRLVFSPTARLPGPWYTKLGMFFVVYHDYHGTKRMWIHNLHLKFGPVVRLGSNEVSFASVSAMKDIYSSRGGLAKTEIYSLFQQDGHRNLFTALDKDEHREKKKRLVDRYSNSSVLRRPILDLLDDRAKVFARECAKTASADIYFYLHCYALDCVTAVCFDPHGTKSIEGGKDGEMVRKLSYHDSRRTLVLRHHYPHLATLYSTLTTQSIKGGSSIRSYAWKSMRQKDHSPVTLASRLLEFPDDELSMAEKVAECLDHIGAGIDTTGDTLCFLMHELSLPHNAPRMARLTEELHCSQAGTDNNAAPKLDTLPYLDAVISEALRLWAPGTLPLPRYVPVGGSTLDGYFVPGGTVVSCQSYTIHRYDQKVFANPEAFMPERWLANGDAAERKRHMFAFGMGPHLCIGKNLAMAEMRALLYSVYSTYRTTIADDMQFSMDMADQLMTSRPEGMCCKLTFHSLDS